MLSYVGISTFARAPLATLDTEWKADAGVLGIPFDIALGFRPGARFAPRAIRDASLRYAVPPEGLWNWHSDETILAGRSIRDVGDVDLPSLETELAYARIEAAARALRKRCSLPVFLGGDHSVTYPVLRAFDDVEALHVVQLDAHLDFTDVRDGTKWSNSSPFRRAVEALPNLAHVSTIGVRGLRTDREAVMAARARGHTIVHADQVTADGHVGTEVLPEGRSVYLSIDLDVFDPSVLSGTSSPEVDGLTYRQVARIIRTVTASNTIVGIDCVELSPALDASGLSALVAARLLVESLGMVLR
ncbi:MAG TPA: arginase family protein [Gemmatimonadaceae bacterium]|nr:arginase family protein [Gemmatimonadaceae bacterium]